MKRGWRKHDGCHLGHDLEEPGGHPGGGAQDGWAGDADPRSPMWQAGASPHVNGREHTWEAHLTTTVQRQCLLPSDSCPGPHPSPLQHREASPSFHSVPRMCYGVLQLKEEGQVACGPPDPQPVTSAHRNEPSFACSFDFVCNLLYIYSTE